MRGDRRGNPPVLPGDAVSAAQSGRARGAPKGRDGAVEAVRALMVAKRSARSERTQAINQARALIVTGPESCEHEGHRRQASRGQDAISADTVRCGSKSRLN